MSRAGLGGRPLKLPALTQTAEVILGPPPRQGDPPLVLLVTLFRKGDLRKKKDITELPPIYLPRAIQQNLQKVVRLLG